MKILLFGKNGQVANRLCISLLPIGDIVCVGSSDVDFTDTYALRQCIQHHAPTCIVNAAAYTSVDKAEDEPDLAFAINSEAVRIISEESRKIDALLVHYSTDYIFDGTKDGLYTEDDIPNPLSIYGASKLKGEECIRQSGCPHLIIRTSWVFDSNSHNFAKTILKLAKDRDVLSIVHDQIGAPTSAQLIADVTSHMIHKTTSKEHGTYNLTSQGYASWYDFAKSLITYAEAIGIELRCRQDAMMPILASEYKVKAKRPLNSRLDLTKIEKTFDLCMPHWNSYIPSVIDELYARNVI